tara:strand:+ start:11174 stop:11836 length:663 start_codon:yes stop_codon:yes gene_type:complete
MPAGIKKFDIDPANSDPNGIAEDQQPTSSVPFVLNGAMSDLGTPLQFDIGDAYSSGIGGIQLTFESAASWAAVTFTIVGKDENGKAQTATQTGPTTTITTSTYWSQVTEISASGTVATDIEVGPADIFVTKAVPLNKYADPYAIVAITGLAGTIQFDIEETFDNLQVTETLDISWFTKVSNATAEGANVLDQQATAARVHVDSYTDTAEFQATVSYNPFR